MEGSLVCTHSIFDLISKLAECHLHDERTRAKQTDAGASPGPAEVSKRRTKIFEALLRVDERATCPRLDSFPKCNKLLEEQRAFFDLKLVTDITYCLFNICIPAYDKKQISEYLRLHPPINDRNAYNKIRIPEPLRLKAVVVGQRRQGPCFGLSKTFKLNKDIGSKVQIDGQSQYFHYHGSREPLKSLPEHNLFASTWKETIARLHDDKFRIPPMRLKLPYSAKPKIADKIWKVKEVNRVNREKHFFSDLNLSNETKWHEDRTIKLHYIELPDLIDHLKKVSVGLQSETFSLKPDGYFILQANKTLRTLLPEVLADYAQPFVDSGRAYLRLYFRTQWDLNRVERPLNRTMRHAIIQIISNSQIFLLSQSANNLSQLLRGAAPIMQILRQLDQMFQNDPSANIAEGTSGASLLSLIWSEIDMCVNIQYLHILMYILRLVCETYYSQLQCWLYQGQLDEPFNELFVSSTDFLDERSREFFDKGFSVRPNMVPGFLAGYELAIVQCGKYSRLLKSYNPQHMIFKSNPPDLTVCLTQNQLTKMQRKLEFHYKHLKQNITPFSMQSVLKERTASKLQFSNRMWSCTQEHISNWESNQRELLIIANDEKQRRYKELNNERMEQEEMRLEHRRTEIATELAFQQKREEQDEERLRREKEILEDRVAALQKIVKPMEINVAQISPDESSCSYRSFVSCYDEPYIEKDPVEEAQQDPKESASDDTLTEVTLKEARESEAQITKESDHNNFKDVVMEMDRNRQRILSSEQFMECQTEVKLCETTASHVLTDAESNRLRVLNCTDTSSQLPPDVNMNLESLSDMQRYRQRNQGHQPFALSKDTTSKGTYSRLVTHIEEDSENNLSTHLSTDPHELYVKSTLDSASPMSISSASKDLDKHPMHLPLEPHKLFVDTALDAATPMSTTSDVEVELFIANEVVDAANNNINGVVDCAEDNEGNDQAEASPNKLSYIPERVAFDNRMAECRKPVFQLHKTEFEKGALRFEVAKDHNPYLIKRFIEQSILMPLEIHLSLLRNEVLRIFGDLNVYEHFCQLRNYFFLLDGEFGTALIGGILARLESGMNPRSLCQKGTLDVILNNAIGHRATEGTGAAAVFTENLTLNCSNIPESFDLMNIDVLSIFTLHCKVDWPLNLVISVEAMTKYTQIFSYLLKLRHVSFMLERAYQHLLELAKLHGKAIHMAPQYRHLQLVRRKLSHFVITLQNHLDTNALQGTWQTFNEKFSKVNSVEELYQRHVEYVKQIAFISLLNRKSAKFRSTIDSILVIVLRFCKILHSKPFVLDQNQEFIHPRYKRLVFEEAEFEKFMHYVIYLGNKIDASGYQEKIVELISIINFNNYYNVTNCPQTK